MRAEEARGVAGDAGVIKEFVPLTSVTKLNPSLKGLKANLEEPTSFVPMSAISGDTQSITAEEQRPLKEVMKGYTYFESGDVLLAKITPCFENGKLALAEINCRFGFGSTEFHVIRADAEALDARYLYHFFRQPMIKQLGEKKMTGSAGQRRVPKSFLESLEIYLPPLEHQKHIARVLDKADELRAKRRRTIARLDELLKSVFLEMFGDPATNSKGWPELPLGDTAIKIADGPFGSNLKSSHYQAEGVRVIRLQNIGVGYLDDRDQAFVSAEHFSSLPNNHCIPGDVIVGTMGAPNLRACIIPSTLKRALNKADCVLYRINPQLIDLRRKS